MIDLARTGRSFTIPGDTCMVPNHNDRADIERIVDLLVGRLVARIRTEQGIDLTLGPRARARLLVELTADLHLADLHLDDLHPDDHGVGSALENMLITPLEQALSTHGPTRSGTLTVTDVAREYGDWTVSLA
ncbi:hypothetical protein ND748_00125 [Frankia sp. AiPs1]|uniref:hypothetical protein n=1 Tax=Frankia sp. AiPs1 TaxID=573493 RepID=UPI0020430522|nr:hypothetical protein [Frankia sp. AiPs1]MCM3920104.1 hypothetical protein [Frankia sp. AiPs1]